MQAATVADPRISLNTTRQRPIRHLVIGWVLLLPLMFFAIGGKFSFEDTSNGIGDRSSLSGLASSGGKIGFVGYVVIPGIVYSILLWLIVTNLKRIVSLALQMKLISFLAVLAVCSALWSQDPVRSAYNGVFYCIETLFAFYLVVKFDPEEILSLVMLTGGSLCVFSLILVFIFPQFGVIHGPLHPGAWHGIFGDRTTAAKCAVFLLSPAIIFRRKSFNYRHITYVALMALFIFMAQATTARIVLLFYVALMAAIHISEKFGRRSSLVITGGVLVAVVVVVCIGLPFIPRVLEGLGKDATLTGRTGIWIALVRSIAKRPLLGYGYYAFWQGVKGESANVIVATHWVFGYAHNGIIEVCLQLGLFGTTVFFLTLLQAVRDAWVCLRKGCSPSVVWFVGLIALTIIYNIDECTVLWPFDLLSILYVIACCGLARAAKRLREIRKIEALYS
jgi:exopolysaccharide production protein ExoQ